MPELPDDPQSRYDESLKQPFEGVDVDSATEPSATSHCFLCLSQVLKLCIHCGQDFCSDHASKYDTRLCCRCISDSNLSTESSPLEEDDGTTRQGRHIRLIGEGWPNTLELIQSLSDEDLELKIAELKQRVKQAEISLDYSRITLASAEFEKGDRYHNKLRRLRSIRMKATAQGAVRLNAKTHRVVSEAEKLAKTLGLSLEDAQRVMRTLGK